MSESGVMAGRTSKLLCLLAVISSTAFLGACAGARSWQESGGAAHQSYVPNDSRQHPAVNYALAVVGKPYRYGSAGPESFDCSGLVEYSFNRAGVSVPRTSAAQYRAANQVSLANARSGDLLFFGTRKNISHVAIYLGEQQFVHAPSSGKNVTVANLNSNWYRNNFIAVGRLPGS
jgi:cell wall-associated NlpC family hydrolase